MSQGPVQPSKTLPSGSAKNEVACFSPSRAVVFASLRPLGELRELVLENYRARGGASSWLHRDRVRLLDAMIDTEDAYESKRDTALVSALRGIRRELESLVWP